jgi:hypothetical protein
MKIYVVMETLDETICAIKAFKTWDAAEKFREQLEDSSESEESDFSIETVELED